MKKTGWFLAVLIIPVISSCQQAQQQKTAGISRKDRLVANENLNLKGEIKQCRGEIEKQKKLLERCRQENNEMAKKADDTTGENQNLQREMVQYQHEIKRQKQLFEQYQHEIKRQKQLFEQYQQMLDSKDDPALCRNKIEKQKKLLEQCRQEKAKIEQQDGETIKWLMDELPKDLLKDIERLTEENKQLRAEIAHLGGRIPEAEKAEQ